MGRIFIIFLFISFTASSQTQGVGPKGKLHFNVGPEYRITPIYNTAVEFSDEENYTNIDKQNSGPALNIGLEYFVTQNFSIGFINSFRYDLVISEFTDIDSPFGVRDDRHKLLFGYHFVGAYYFNIGNGDFFVNAGVSFLNRNSDFSTRETFFDENGQISFTGVSISADYHITANKLSLGYTKGKSKLFLGMYFSRQAPYFNETTSFIIPHIGYSYKIANL